MPVNRDENNMLISLFMEHGLESYIKSTRSLLVLLSEGGKLLAGPRLPSGHFTNQAPANAQVETAGEARYGQSGDPNAIRFP